MGLTHWVSLIALIFIDLMRMVWLINLNKIALKEYQRSNDSAKALHKLEKWDLLRQYIIIFTGFLIGIFVWNLWKQTTLYINELNIFEQYQLYGINMIIIIIMGVPIVSVLFYINTANLTDVVISHKTYKAIRNIKQTIAEALLENFRAIFLIIDFIVLLFLFSILLGHFIPLEWLFEWLFGTENNLSNIEKVVEAIILIVVRFFIPVFVLVKIIDIVPVNLSILFSKASRIKDREIESFASEFLCGNVKRTLKVYEFPSKDSKYANALVVDDSKGRILISDYAVEQLTKEELKAIIVHEIGHIKNRHLKKMYIGKASVLLPYVKYFLWLLMLSFGFAMVMLPNDSAASNILGFLVVIISILIFIDMIYSSFIGHFEISQKHEKEADEYVIKSGIDPQVYITALQKLYYLNDSPVSAGKLEEKFSTHPSLENRIKYINELARLAQVDDRLCESADSKRSDQE